MSIEVLLEEGNWEKEKRKKIALLLLTDAVFLLSPCYSSSCVLVGLQIYYLVALLLGSKGRRVRVLCY
jgi:thiol:disulfide interchange protein